MSTIGDAMLFAPRFPWNDDERDTTSYIEHYSYLQTETDDEYVPTFCVMKEFYREEQCKGALYSQPSTNNDEWYQSCYYGYFGLTDDDSTSNPDSLDYSLTDHEEDGESAVKADDGDDGTISSPYVSNKYWYM
jgi:hypothetical protein